MAVVNGPASSVIGHLAVWSNVTGSSVSDGGLPAPQWVNAVQYGADPTGASASDPGITNAINALVAANGVAGGVVYFPPGKYLISSVVPVTHSNIFLVGDGPGTVTLFPATATQDIFDISGAGSVVQGMSINSFLSGGQTAGFFISQSGSNSRVSNVSMNAAHGGISLTGSIQVVELVNITSPTNGSTGIFVNSGGGPAGAYTWINKVFMNGTGATPNSGITIANSGDFIIENCEIEFMSTGLAITPGNGASASGWVVNTYFDNSQFNGILISPSGTGQANQIRIDNVWTGNLHASAVGINILSTGSNPVSDIYITGMLSPNAALSNIVGVTVGAGVSKVTIANCQISGVTYGIFVNPVVTDLTIQGNQIHNYSTAGIVIGAGASNRYIITNNQLFNSGVAASAIIDGGSGTNKFVGGATGAGLNIS